MRMLFFLLAFFPGITVVYAQTDYTDSSRLTRSAHYAKKVYDSQRAGSAALFNGIQFYPYSRSIEGLAFFKTANWQKGTILYDNVLYEDISIKYDQVKDQLIVVHDEKNGLSIGVYSPRVSAFSLGNASFLRLGTDHTKGAVPEGFYQELVTGKLSAYVKKTKWIEEKIADNSIRRNFDSTAKYYIHKDGIFYSVRNENDLLRVVKERRKEIQQLLSGQKLKFKKEPEKSIVAALQFYNQ